MVLSSVLPYLVLLRWYASHLHLSLFHKQSIFYGYQHYFLNGSIQYYGCVKCTLLALMAAGAFPRHRSPSQAQQETVAELLGCCSQSQEICWKAPGGQTVAVSLVPFSRHFLLVGYYRLGLLSQRAVSVMELSCRIIENTAWKDFFVSFKYQVTWLGVTTQP